MKSVERRRAEVLAQHLVDLLDRPRLSATIHNEDSLVSVRVFEKQQVLSQGTLILSVLLHDAVCEVSSPLGDLSAVLPALEEFASIHNASLEYT